jgi:hypothetical protein
MGRKRVDSPGRAIPFSAVISVPITRCLQYDIIAPVEKNDSFPGRSTLANKDAETRVLGVATSVSANSHTKGFDDFMSMLPRSD